MKSIYNLKLFEILPVETGDKELWTSVMRVPGGWIFRSYDKSHLMLSTTFVPFDNSYMVLETPIPQSNREGDEK